MKYLQVILSLSLLSLVFTLLVVESSSLNDTLVSSNITRGSSLSTYSNDSSYWLSPSGNIAFGFYQLPWSPDRYVVGIWFVKSELKTLVWTANRDDPALHKPSSILFNNDGKLMLRTPDYDKEKLLIPDVQVPVSYAKMHDNGNLVLYDSDSQIVWKSFDYPTDTILSGQKLRPGVDLISGYHRLSVQQTNGLVAIYEKTNFGLRDDDQGEISGKSVSVSHALKGSVSRPLILSLDTTGNLYLVGSDDVVLKYLYRDRNQECTDVKETVDSEGQQLIICTNVHIYRATLDSEGRFNLYKERIDGNIRNHEKSSSVLVKRWPIHHMGAGEIVAIAVCYVIVFGFLLVVCWDIYDKNGR